MVSFFLFFTIVLPLVAILHLSFQSPYNINKIRLITLYYTYAIFLLSVILFIFWYFSGLTFSMNLLGQLDFLNVYLNSNYFLFVDGISIWFILLTTFLFPLVVLVSWESIKYNPKLYFILLLLIEFSLLNLFCVEELFLFYIFFETAAIPMFLMIGVWGSSERRIYASFKFFLYTIVGSVLMFLAIIWIYFQTGLTHFSLLLDCKFALLNQIFLFLAFFSSFAVKIPMMPIHLWLPEAHVEAPTGISVLLAGILLKTGGYGFIRFVLPLCPEASQIFAPLIFLISIISVLYGSMVALVQTDLKKMVAYSSVAHMNMVTIGLFSGSLAGLDGAVYLMLTHGVISSGLFICVGILYDRYHTRVIRYYGGLTNFMPIFAICFLILILANISFPSTGSFIGEFIILSDVFSKNTVVAFLAGFGIILGAFYSVWLYNRVMFGAVDSYSIRYYSDLNSREFFILLVILFFTFFMGIFPTFFFIIMEPSLMLLNETFICKF